MKVVTIGLIFVVLLASAAGQGEWIFMNDLVVISFFGVVP